MQALISTGIHISIQNLDLFNKTLFNWSNLLFTAYTLFQYFGL